MKKSNYWLDLKTNKLNEGGVKAILKSLNRLSLAKNIKLMEGTASVWEQLVTEDIIANIFILDDFIKAVDIGVRMPMYNRIDYADIYTEAVAIAKKRKQAEINERQRIENSKPKNGVPMPEDLRTIIKRLGDVVESDKPDTLEHSEDSPEIMVTE